MNKKKILVADDDKIIVRLLNLRLKMYNFDVITASDGRQCIQLAELERPDLILLDIKMPKFGGIAAFEELRSKSSTKQIPIIFITAYPDPEIKTQVMIRGANGFISKPFTGEELIAKINSIIDN